MRQKRPVSVQLSDQLQLPPQLRPRVPVVELVGRNTLILTRHHGLKEYTAQRISADTVNGTISVEGSGLVITKMNSDTLTVSGTICSVSFPEDAL